LQNIKPFQNILLFGVTIVIFVYICSIGMRNIFRYNKFKRSYDETVFELNIEQKKYQKFKQILADMKSLDYWELQGKKRLGFVKNDEIVYVISPKDP
jgi:cell division protein FtsB